MATEEKLTRDIESLPKATQNNAMRTIYLNAKIHKVNRIACAYCVAIETK